jgi:hypothetical protein
MPAEDEILFACTRQRFTETHQERVKAICSRHNVDWQKLYFTAREHGVAPLVYANLQQCTLVQQTIPREIQVKFNQCLFQNIAVKERAAVEIEAVLKFLNKKSIPVMLVKGAALNFDIYDLPWYTTSEDVDLILKVKTEEVDKRELSEITEFLEALNRAHKALVEHIEYDYFEHHDVTMNRVLPVRGERIWRDAQQVNFRGQNVWIMSLEDTFIATCINSCRKRYFRLKSLCDIAEILRNSPQLNWEAVKAKAQEYDCHNIVYTALLVTQMTLGCELPSGTLAKLKVHPIRRWIIRRLAIHLRHRGSLLSLTSHSKTGLLGRKISAPLMLTYASYRWYQIGRKLQEIYHNWRNLQKSAVLFV